MYTYNILGSCGALAKVNTRLRERWMDGSVAVAMEIMGGETCSPFRRKWTHEMITDQKFGTLAHRARTHTVYYHTLSIIQAQLIMNEQRNVPVAAKAGLRRERERWSERKNMFFGQKHNKHTFEPPSN